MDRSEVWFPSPDSIFLGNGLGDRAVILGIFKPVCLECQALPTLRFTSFSSLTLLSDGCSYGRVESDLLITRFAVDVSCYFHCPIAESDSIHTHPFKGPLSGTTRASRYQKGKTNLDFTEARDGEWQWHQLGYASLCLAPDR